MRSPLIRRRMAKGFPARKTLIAALLSAVASGFIPAVAQQGPPPEPLNLFQLIARSDLVALVKVRDGSLKYALVDSVRTLKGTAPGPHLRIAFRDFNFTRRPGEDTIVFPAGAQEILFLVPFKTPRRKKDVEKFKDLYTLFQGRQGRIPLPAEGPEVILEAIDRLAPITHYDAASQIEALTALLDSSNPYLVESSLSEIERLRAAGTPLLEKLVSFLGSRSPILRGRSLRVIAQVFASALAAGDEALDDARGALGAVLERARNDADESVRVQAVTAVAVWPKRKDVEGDLRAIAGTDQAQAVRFEAEKALLRR